MTIPKLLFFFVENEFCRQYFHQHVAKYDDATEAFNLTQKAAVALDMATTFNVTTAPTLIMLNEKGEQTKRWDGGTAPEPGYLSVEVGLYREYVRQQQRQQE